MTTQKPTVMLRAALSLVIAAALYVGLSGNLVACIAGNEDVRGSTGWQAGSNDRSRNR